MKKQMSQMQRVTREREERSKGGHSAYNDYLDDRMPAKVSSGFKSSYATTRPQSACKAVRLLSLPKAQPVHVSTIPGGRQIMRISTNESHNMKTNQGYARKACGGFYRIM